MRSSSQSFSASCKSFARASTFLSRSCSTSSAWYCSSSKANCKILAHFKTRFRFSSADTVTSSSMCVFTSCLAPDVSSATTAEVSVFPGAKEDKSRDSSRGHCWLRCSPRAGKDSGSMVAASAHNLTLPPNPPTCRLFAQRSAPGPARATMASPARGLFCLGARAPPRSGKPVFKFVYDFRLVPRDAVAAGGGRENSIFPIETKASKQAIMRRV